MKKLLAAAAFALALAAPSGASAQASYSYVGGRIAYAFPYGTTAGVAGASLSQRDVLDSVVPLQIDAGLRFGPIDLGGYGAYGFGSAGSACPGSCSANQLRLGVQGVLHSALMSEREVWAGVLLGWERVKVSPSSGGDTTASGWEAGLQAGYDFAGSSFGFGPYGMLTVGEYDSLDRGGASVSGFDKKRHGVFQLGVRGFFRI